MTEDLSCLDKLITHKLNILKKFKQQKNSVMSLFYLRSCKKFNIRFEILKANFKVKSDLQLSEVVIIKTKMFGFLQKK